MMLLDLTLFIYPGKSMLLTLKHIKYVLVLSSNIVFNYKNYNFIRYGYLTPWQADE
jgi:hypothetical protein